MPIGFRANPLKPDEKIKKGVNFNEILIKTINYIKIIEIILIKTINNAKNL